MTKEHKKLHLVNPQMILNTTRGGNLSLAADPVFDPFAFGKNTSSSSA